MLNRNIDTDIHVGSFALPNYVKEQLKDVE